MKPYKLLTQLKRQIRNGWQRSCAALAAFIRRHLLQRYRRGRPRLDRQAGFVLPTTIMLLLVMSLVVGGILIRTFNRTEQVISGREAVKIYNDATPAIDRAKAKLEYMFLQDKRVPAGIPSETLLTKIMLDNPDVETPEGEDPPPDNVYTFPGEERLILNGRKVNAWAFGVDNDGDGTADDENGNGRPDTVVAYSIIWETPDGETELLKDQTAAKIEERAQAFQVRQGPLSGDPTPNCNSNDATSRIESGWLRDPVITSILRKNFQITAVAIPDTEFGTIATLELQQERQADRGNKWAAWFRNDLEIFPGAPFKWNGAMHTEGSLIIGSARDSEAFFGYLVSGIGSCLYQAGPSTSENTINVLTSGDEETFRGHMVVGRVGSDTESGAPQFHLWGETPNYVPGEVSITPETDSASSVTISDIILDPVKLFTKDETQHRGAAAVRNPAWTESAFVSEGRVLNRSSNRPYIDDFYRADDRFGPNPGYGGKENLLLVAQEVKTGDPITGDSTAELTQNTAQPDEDPLNLGLDGYWERRAWREGMRTIVGQRLELGGDPLSTVPDLKTIDPDQLTPGRPNQSLQRRSLRDPLAAVQTTAIYHSDDPRSAAGEEATPPYAALLSTVHPGTAETLKQSAIFDQVREPLPMKSQLDRWFGPAFGDAAEEPVIDFLAGRGTNGWELNVKEGFFESPEVNDALARLANFAGDPDGAFPAVQNGVQHPYPSLTQWGDFSNLRRTMTDDQESFADYSNKHTAAITIGALANQIAFLDGIDYEQIKEEPSADPPSEPPTNLLDRLDKALQSLDNRICDLDNYSSAGNIQADSFADDGVCLAANNGLSNGEVIFYPNEDLNHNGRVDAGEDFDGNDKLIPALPTMVIYAPTTLTNNYKAIARVAPSPDAYITALEARVEQSGISATEKAERQTIAQFARFVMEKEQVERDRHFGFRSSYFGFDTIANTIDTATPTAIGQYQYYVKYLLDEDYNGNLKLDSDTAGTGNIKVFEVGNTDSNGAPLALGEVEVTGSNLRMENWGGDNEIDFGEDFDRNGIQDLFYSEDLNGDGQLSEIPIPGRNDVIKEDWNANDRLDEFDEAEDGGNSDDYEITNRAAGNPLPRYVFTPRSEDLNGNGTFDSALNERDLAPPLPPGLYGRGFWDLNGNDTPDTGVSDFNEDINNDDDDTSNDDDEIEDSPQFDIFRHRGAIYYPGVVLHVGCDFSSRTGNNYFGFGVPDNAKSEARFIRLASSLCSTEAKYPALYYLFPKYEHGYRTSTVDLNGDGTVSELDDQPLFALTEDVNHNGRLDPGEDGYDRHNPARSLNARKNEILDGEPLSYTSDESYDQEAVSEESYISSINTATYEAVDLAALEQIALKPQPITRWVLPYINRGTDPGDGCSNDAQNGAPNPNCSKYNLVYDAISGAYYRVAFKDTAFFDGREQLVTRALNLDMAMLADKDEESVVNGTIEGNTWLTGGNNDEDVVKDGGIVFAFREDAMREDGVARPAGGSCEVASDGGCYDQDSLAPQDPAVDPDNGISAKAVNLIPDPARRTHGFRIINGMDISRPKQGGFTEYGLTFVSDNPTYVQGDFNCHKEVGDSNCDAPIEEFNYTLFDKDDWGPTHFYNRGRDRRDRDHDDRFTDPEQDSWRYSEFLVDAYTVLSDNFCDGSIEDGFIRLPTGDLRQGLRELDRTSSGQVRDLYGCPNSGINATSFLNQSLPKNTTSGGVTITNSVWQRENPADPASPIRISPNGQPMFLGVGASEYNADYLTAAERNAISYKQTVVIPPTSTQTQNAVIIAGLIPSRQFQSYGGLHNFPRFLENRDGYTIYMSGSFLNLKFSSQATAPFDQQTWEAGEEPVAGGGLLPFYRAPERNWGYDVGLQLTRPGPVSSRLTTTGSTRAEFYRELPADDPYVLNLRCASFNGSQIDENASLSGSCS